jgi:glucose/arabinose dehydrogenase
VKFGPDGKLYVTTGDAENGANAQNASVLAGTILRMNKDGSIPPDNPTAGSLVWSLGHRNVQGIAWHPDTGALYETEHGPSNPFPDCCHDEVNLIVQGGNYGWPTVRGIAGDQRFRDPLLESGAFETWAPSGTAFATKPGPIRGSLLFAALRGQHLHRVVFGPDGRTVLFHEKLLTNQYGRLRDVFEIPSGEFLVLTSNRDGRGLPRPDDDRVLLVTLR